MDGAREEVLRRRKRWEGVALARLGVGMRDVDAGKSMV